MKKMMFDVLGNHITRFFLTSKLWTDNIQHTSSLEGKIPVASWQDSETCM